MSMSRSSLRSMVWVAGFSLGLGAAGVVHADGFRNPPPGGAGLGRSGTFMAQVDDASAISYNPANLTLLPSSEIMVAASVARTQVEFRNRLGQAAESDDPWQMLPNVYAALKLDEDWALGVGVTTPYGQSSEWDRESVLKYQAPYFAQMTLVNVNPSAAWRVNEALSVGAGVDVFASTLEFKQAFPWGMALGAPGAPDGTAKLDVEGAGVGANAGLTWSINAAHRLALTYRSPVKVEFDGDFSVSGAPPFVPGAGRAGDASTDITFPDIVGAAYGIQVTEAVRVEAGVEWLGWSRYDVMDLDVGANRRLLAESRIRNDWNDTITCSVGADWAVSETWILRAGYAFIESPIPDETFSPILPDADRHVVALGVGWRRGAHAVDAAVTYNIYDDRTIRTHPNPALNGEYEMESDLFSVSYRRTF